jgi:spermidine synthase
VLGGVTAFTDGGTDYQLYYAALALILLFLVSVSLHGQLYRRRPDASHLTRFYLAMSVGGVIGGLFCALVAPLIFNWGYEHPILLLAAALALPHYSSLEWISDFWEEHGSRLSLFLPTLALLIALFAVGALFGAGLPEGERTVPAALIVIICVLCRGQRFPFMFSLAALMLTMGGAEKLERSASPGVMTRSYFGIYMVWSDSNKLWRLSHGTTIHGVQDRNPGRERQPLSYYAPQSGIGIAMKAAPALFGQQARIGVVGLGSGTLACYSQPGQHWRFYEIDPAMEVIARDPKRFTFLSTCLPKADIAIGDARLVLAKEAAGQADMLAIDAFSSDAVPMHLLTREAFATYGHYLKPGGLLIVHVSNRFLNLEPVVAGNLGSDWHGAVRAYWADDDALRQHFTHSTWIALSRDQAVLDRLIATDDQVSWTKLTAKPGFSPWTDDFASILPVLKPFWRR